MDVSKGESMNIVFSIQKGIITCHKFTKKLKNGYRLDNGEILKGEKPTNRKWLEPLDVVTITESRDEALAFSKQEVDRMHDLIQVARGSIYDVEDWVKLRDGCEDSPPKTRIL